MDRPPKPSAELQGEVRGLLSNYGVTEPGRQSSVAPQKDENDSAGRDKHRHIKDTQQESLVAQPAAGFGSKEAAVEQPEWPVGRCK